MCVLFMQLSRERKKVYVSTLEGQVHELMQNNATLRSQIEALAAENSALRRRLDDGELLASASGSENTLEEGTLALSETAGGRKVLRKAARTGMVLFAVVFSFGVFFHLVGVSPRDHDRLLRIADESELPARVFKGRVLQSIGSLSDDATSDDDSVAAAAAAALRKSAQPEPEAAPRQLQLIALVEEAPVAQQEQAASSPVPLPVQQQQPPPPPLVQQQQQAPSAKATPRKRGWEGAAADGGVEAVQALGPGHLRSLAQQLQDKMRGFGLRLPELGNSSQPPRAAAAADGAKAPTPIIINSGTDGSREVAFYHENERSIQETMREALELYKKMLTASNSSGRDDTELPTSIMFCPSAIHFPAPPAPPRRGAANSKQVMVKKLGPNASAPGAAPARARSEQMYLWVPSRAIAADWDMPQPEEAAAAAAAPPKRAKAASPARAGLTELTVKVAAMRSVA